MANKSLLLGTTVRPATVRQVPEKVFLDLDAYTIAQFCERHGISRATYYVLKKRGLQPAETHILDRILITRESAATWRKKRTAESRRADQRRAAAWAVEASAK